MGERHNRSALRYLISFIILLLVACAQVTPAPVTRAWKISIAEPGMYRVTNDDLPGLRAGPDTLAHLHLTHHGQELPLEFEETGNNPGIVFYAEPNAVYSPTDIYWLKLGDTPGVPISTRNVAGQPQGRAAASFDYSLKLEQDRIYSTMAVGGTHWFWQSLSAPVTQTIEATVIAPQSGDGQIQVTFAGVTTGSHLARVRVNDAAVGEARWTGQTVQALVGKVNNLRLGVNTVTLEVPGENDQVDVMFLDSITFSYPREFSAEADVLEFGRAQDVRVRGFQRADVRLYDITDPTAVQKLDGMTTSSENGATSIAFHDEREGRQYLALASAALRRAADIHPVQPISREQLADSPADYVVVAPSNFTDALQPLVRHRAEQGFKPRVVNIEQIYDAFSDGVPDPHALRAFIQYARENWHNPAPRFVLLVGKASYDYRDFLNAKNKNLIPTWLMPTAHLGEAASDNWFVAQSDNDAQPALAIGRIPASTPQQVTIAINKLLAYEAAPPGADWSRRAVFVADNQEPVFNASADKFISSLPGSIEARRVYLSAHQGDIASTRAELLNQWNEGAGLVTYVGHGSIDTWAMGPLFSSQNLDGLRNANRLPILLTPTCLDGFFYHPDKDSLAEGLLFKEGGGIVAGLVPTGLSVPYAQDILMQGLFEAMFQPAPTLGEAIERAKQKLDPGLPDEREVLDTFVLLGDPALKLKPPP